MGTPGSEGDRPQPKKREKREVELIGDDAEQLHKAAKKLKVNNHVKGECRKEAKCDGDSQKDEAKGVVENNEHSNKRHKEKKNQVESTKVTSEATGELQDKGKDKKKKKMKDIKDDLALDVENAIDTQKMVKNPVEDGENLEDKRKEKKKKKKENKIQIDDVETDNLAESKSDAKSDAFDAPKAPKDKKKKKRKMQNDHLGTENLVTNKRLNGDIKMQMFGKPIEEETSGTTGLPHGKRRDRKKKKTQDRKDDFALKMDSAIGSQEIIKDKSKPVEDSANLEEDKRKEKGGKKKNKNENKIQNDDVEKAILPESKSDGKTYAVDSLKVSTDKRKKKQKIQSDHLGTENSVTNKRFNGGKTHMDGKPIKEAEDSCHDTERTKEKKRKEKWGTQGPGTKNSTPSRSARKVTFADDVEVFPSSDSTDAADKDQGDGKLIRGKRFSKEEDAIIQTAVNQYIELHGLGDKGIDMIMHCQSHPEVKNCWKEIGASIPWRPQDSVYYRAHILFERGDKRSWTPEELELVRRFVEKHGSNWKALADAIGKHRVHVKDAWRRIRLLNMKKGHWSREEYQTLFDLVNTDLRMKAFDEKRSKYGMLRDNIPWSAISDKLGTRNHSVCCTKWYDQLTSPMVGKGIWDNADDYRMLDALLKLDATCVEDVDWDDLLEQRSGDICRKRWNQMVLHIGLPGSKSFPEQVEILSKRYCPDLAEVREEFDNRPAVP